MSGSIDTDQMLQKTIRLLHSTQPGSATDLRLMLDDLIKHRYGSEKTLSNTISKRFLEEENDFPGMVATPSPSQEQQHQSNDSDEVINLTHSPETIADSDDNMSSGGAAGSVSGTGMGLTSSAEEDTNLKEFNDLNCCVCNEMVFTATNRLIECSKCNMLYHQECHKPPITDEEASEDQGFSWQCDNCCNKPSTTRAAGIVVVEEPIPLVSKTKSSAASSRSSSSSNSSSPFHKQDNIAGGTSVITTAAQQPSTQSTSTSSSGKHHHHHHHHKSSSSSSHSSGKSSSKHQDSGSSKRKSKSSN